GEPGSEVRGPEGADAASADAFSRDSALTKYESARRRARVVSSSAISTRAPWAPEPTARDAPRSISTRGAPMRIQLLTFPGCANADAARDLLSRLLPSRTGVPGFEELDTL